MTAYLNGKRVKSFWLDGEQFTKAPMYFTVKTKEFLRPYLDSRGSGIPKGSTIHLWGPDYNLFATYNKPVYVEAWESDTDKDRGWGGIGVQNVNLYTLDQIEPLITPDTKFYLYPV